MTTLSFFANMLFFHLHFAPAVGPKGGAHPRLEISGWPKVFFLACYLPLPLWPLLLAACTVAYRRRRRKERDAPRRSGGAARRVQQAR
jgi:hypothetical protein